MNGSLKGKEDMRAVIVVSGYRIGSDPDCGRCSSFDGLHLLLQLSDLTETSHGRNHLLDEESVALDDSYSLLIVGRHDTTQRGEIGS